MTDLERLLEAAKNIRDTIETFPMLESVLSMSYERGKMRVQIFSEHFEKLSGEVEYEIDPGWTYAKAEKDGITVFAVYLTNDGLGRS